MNGQKGRGRGCMHTLPYQSMYRKPTVFPTDRERERATRSIRFKTVLEEVTVGCVVGEEEKERRGGGGAFFPEKMTQTRLARGG